MTNGITVMWDDATHYEWLAKYYKVPVRFGDGGLWWPYNMDNEHYEELLERYRQDMLKREKEMREDD